MMSETSASHSPRRPRGWRRLTLAVAVSAASLAGLVTAAPPASATLGDLTCFTNAAIYFSPALRAGGTSAVTATVSGVGCVSLNGNYPDLQSFTANLSGSATAASLPINPCSLLLTIAATGQTLNWNTGQQSTFNATLNTNPLAGTLSLTGTMTGGPLAGDTLLFVPVVVPNLDCLTAGLTSLAVPVVLLTWF
jgi:hypothetical protein